jgi:type III restriction enzyme
MEMMQLGVEVHQTEVDIEYFELGRDQTSYITQHVMKRAGLTDCFHFLYPICEDYILNKCFEVKIDEIEKEELRKVLRELSIQEAIIDLLAKEIGKATVEKKQVKVKGEATKLSDTPKFTWRRGHIKLRKTVFNFVATYNDFEKEFAEFLDKADDVEAFSALADIFRIGYLSNSGAIRYYFPDFVAVQTVGKKKVYWILETKGREYPDLDNKNKAIYFQF